MFSSEFVTAVAAIILHVVNYNVTAQIEYYTHIFTKIIGKNAIYFYAVYLIASALLRDHFIHVDLQSNANTLVLLPADVATYLGYTLLAVGFLLNLWTLQALGIKGMYNGDSFGHLMDAPVTGGPYKYFNDPQYVGTAICMLGSAVQHQSFHGYVLTGVLFLVFQISVRFIEGPHMNKIYSNKNKTKKN